MKQLIYLYYRLFHFRRGSERPVTVAELLTTEI
ncbi:Uncharacterised protein [Mycobacteroides abscessus]|nr:Uncharacterised protein [Mycobacteroides abscessus]CPW85973.1 Uncharacterised protein [Mycobacteroides abscessus]